MQLCYSETREEAVRDTGGRQEQEAAAAEWPIGDILGPLQVRSLSGTTQTSGPVVPTNAGTASPKLKVAHKLCVVSVDRFLLGPSTLPSPPRASSARRSPYHAHYDPRQAAL